MLLLMQLSCCCLAVALQLSPRGTHSTAGSCPLLPLSNPVHAQRECTYFQAEWCRDGGEKRERVIQCSVREADHISRLQGVISHCGSESEVRIHFRACAAEILDATATMVASVVCSWPRTVRVVSRRSNAATLTYSCVLFCLWLVSYAGSISADIRASGICEGTAQMALLCGCSLMT